MHDNLAKLDLDVLGLIFAQLVGSKRDISSLMRTCKEIYSIGLPVLTADFGFDQYNSSLDVGPHVWSSFLAFMLAEPSIRPSYLRSLLLNIHFIPKDLLSSIDALLRAASGLHEVLIIDEDVILDRTPPFLDALTSSSSLRILKFDYAGTHAMSLASSLASPSTIETLALEFHPDAAPGDPWPALRRVRHSVTQVTLAHVDYSAKREAGESCPLVYELSLSHPTCWDVAALASSFPNLRNLSIYDVDTDPEPSSTSPISEWKALDKVEMTPQGYLALVIQCPIRHLDLGCYSTAWIEEAQAQAIALLIRKASPVVLRLNLDPRLSPHALRSILSASSALRTLCIASGYEDIHEVDDFTIEPNRLVTSLSSELTTVSLKNVVIYTDNFISRISDQNDVVHLDRSPDVTQQLIRNLAATSQTLRYIFCTSFFDEEKTPVCWEVIRDGTEPPALQRLSDIWAWSRLDEVLANDGGARR